MTNANGCEATQTTIVEAFPDFETSITGARQVCSEETTTLTAVGGTSYLWSNGQTSASIAVGAGNYSVTITSANGCEQVNEVSIDELELPSLQIVENATCSASRDFYELVVLFDQEDVIMIELSSEGRIEEQANNRTLITQIPVGKNTTVTITNASGCSTRQFINAPDCACPALAAPISQGDTSICADERIPVLSVEAVNDNASINWYSTPIGGEPLVTNRIAFQPSVAGTYYAELIETASGCVSSQRTPVTLTINELPELIVAKVTDITCAQTTSVVEVIATGNNPPFQYQINNNEFQSENSFANLMLGDYIIQVQDGAGCTTTVNATVIENTRTDRIQLTRYSCEENEIGIDSILAVNELGCDSTVVTTTLDGRSLIERRLELTCEADEVGMDTLLFTNQFSCDSLIIIERVSARSDTTFLRATTCEPTQAGTRTSLFRNEAGCDSIVVTRTTFAEVSTVVFTESVCDPMQVGADTTFLISQFGCDSLVIRQRILQGITDTTRLQLLTCDFTRIGFDTLILSNQTGCDSLVVTQRIFAFPPPPILMPDVNIQEFCEGDSLVLMTNSYNTGLQWLKDNEDLIGENETSLVIKESGRYGVSYTDEEGCSVVSEIITVIIAPAPAIPALESGETNELRITNGEAYSNETILWYFNGTLLDNDGKLSYCADSTGTYSVIVIDPGSDCSSRAELYVETEETNQNCAVATREALLPVSVQLFPNPTNGKFYLQIETSVFQSVSVIVYDNWGRVVERGVLPIVAKETHEIDLSSYLSGTYWVQLLGENRQSVQKVVKVE